MEVDKIYKGKTREEIIEMAYSLHLQNTNGREIPEEMFKLGISIGYDEFYNRIVEEAKGCPFCGTKMNPVTLIHYKCKECNEYFTD